MSTGSCPAGVQGFESPPPHHTTLSPYSKIDAETTVKIAEHAFWMQKKGYSEATIRAAVKTLRHLARHCNLLNPDSFLNYNATAKYGDTGMIFWSKGSLIWSPYKYQDDVVLELVEIVILYQGQRTCHS